MFIQIVSWRATTCAVKQDSVWFPTLTSLRDWLEGYQGARDKALGCLYSFSSKEREEGM